MNGRIAIIGAGAWGTALAHVLAAAGREVTLWGRRDVTLSGSAPEYLRRTTALQELAGAAAILLVVPAQALREVVHQLAPIVREGLPVIAGAKGIERGTRRFMTEVIAETLPHAAPAILSGPSFAEEVARGLPTAVTLAAHHEGLAQALAGLCSTGRFRVYHSTDVRGVEIGGAAKNVFAIAAGIVIGQKLGASALAAMTTRAFAEMTRFGDAFGARPETLTGLSGLGDLILSCSSPQSRNLSFGIALGSGRPAAEASGGKLVEGAFTAEVLLGMAKDRGVDMPITQAVVSVLGGELSVQDAVTMLLTRPFKAETATR